MFGKSFVTLVTVFSLALLVGQQAPSHAQSKKIAAIVGWAGNNNITTLWPNVNATDDGKTVSGSFTISGLLTSTTLWKVAGASHTLTIAQDGKHAEIVGWVYYTGGTLKNVPAIATLTISLPGGTITGSSHGIKLQIKPTVSIKIVKWFGGSLLFSTGTNPTTNTPNVVPLFKGSVAIVH